LATETKYCIACGSEFSYESNGSGRKRVYCDEHRSRPTVASEQGRTTLARAVMSDHLHRPLLGHEFVKHMDGNKNNVEISNLELHSWSKPRGTAVANKLRWAVYFIKEYRSEAPAHLKLSEALIGLPEEQEAPSPKKRQISKPRRKASPVSKKRGVARTTPKVSKARRRA